MQQDVHEFFRSHLRPLFIQVSLRAIVLEIEVEIIAEIDKIVPAVFTVSGKIDHVLLCRGRCIGAPERPGKKKNREIELLSKNGQIKEAQLSNQRTLLIASIVLLMVTFAGVVLLVSRSRLRQRMKELELRNSIAADLHDEVGSSLSSIHMLSQIATEQNAAKIDPGYILERVSTNAYETMEKMSDIVWMVKSNGDEGQSLHMRMERFTHELCNSRQIDCHFTNGLRDELRLTMPQKKNLYLVFKEALNNAVKYSGTNKVDVQLQLDQNRVILRVKDYGKGFDIQTVAKGNGLDNMKNRAKELKGILEVSSRTGEGTEVKLHFPV